MPVLLGQDANGYYYRWGARGTKYYFDPEDPQGSAWSSELATRQGRAIHAGKRRRGGQSKLVEDAVDAIARSWAKGPYAGSLVHDLG